MPRHILAPAAVACDIYLIRRSVHPRGAFFVRDQGFEPRIYTQKRLEMEVFAQRLGECNTRCNTYFFYLLHYKLHTVYNDILRYLHRILREISVYVITYPPTFRKSYSSKIL